MKLPLGLGTLDWSDWARGLVAAFVSGGASAVTTGVVVSIKDPVHYATNSKDFFELVTSVFVMSGIMSGMSFLREKPLPGTKTTVEQTVTTVSPTQSTTTTIKSVVDKIEPKEKP